MLYVPDAATATIACLVILAVVLFRVGWRFNTTLLVGAGLLLSGVPLVVAVALAVALRALLGTAQDAF